MSQDILHSLRKTNLFHGLSDDALQALAQKVSVRKLVKDDVLMRKGETGDSLFIIHEGWVKIVTEDSAGGELILNKSGPGEVIGDMALVDRGPRTATVIALEDVEALKLDQEAFDEILSQRSDVSLEIIRGFSRRLRFATTYIEKAIDWSQKTAEGDYSFVDQSQPVLDDASTTDDDKAAQLLSAFFTMVRQVKAREDGLKQQLEKLTVEVDQARRKKEFEEITSTEFYAKLKMQAKELREKRSQESD